MELYNRGCSTRAVRHGLFDTSPPAARMFPSSVTEPAGGFMVCDTWNSFFRVFRSCGQDRQDDTNGSGWAPGYMVSLDRKRRDVWCNRSLLEKEAPQRGLLLGASCLDCFSIVRRLSLSIRCSHACANCCARLCAYPLCLAGLDAPRNVPLAHASFPLLRLFNRQRGGGVTQDRGAVRQGGTVRGAGTQPCRLAIAVALRRLSQHYMTKFQVN